MSNSLCVEALRGLLPRSVFLDRDKKLQDLLEKIGIEFDIFLDRANDMARQHGLEYSFGEDFISREEGFSVVYDRNKMTVKGVKNYKKPLRVGKIRVGNRLALYEKDEELMRRILVEKEAHVRVEFYAQD